MTPRPYWLLDYTLWAILGKKDPRPKNVPRRIGVSYIFLPAWVKWRMAGGIPGKRPKSIPANLNAYPWRYDFYHDVKAALEIVNPPPVPKPDPAPSAIRRCLCLADNPLAALRFPRHPVALTADPGYAAHVDDSVVSQLKAGGRPVHAWFVPTQVSFGTAQEFQRRYGLDQLIGQGETWQEMERTLAFGLRYAWVNMSALDQAQLKAITDGRLDVLAEFYRNTQPWLKKDWRGARVTGSLIAVYGPSNGGESPWHRYYPVAEYGSEINPETDGAYLVRFQEADFRDFPQ